ncbi:MAG TPA: ABC transporter substrate-binding protein, partial [Burkholderiales bacterium]|nr:ABC transporter substrate-binding protein [Burkholderiales bacterium]
KMVDEVKVIENSARRDFFRQGAMALGGAALMGMVPTGARQAAWAGGTEGIEKQKLTLGIIPLTDCAPIVVAAEKGFFKKHGLDVMISK